jgi:hypothetical protein
MSPTKWLSPEELVAIGFERSRVVMMNEAHNMFLRSIRTREIGRRVLPTAHDAGVRHIAMEALTPQFAAHANKTRTLPEAEGGYLSQADMRSLIESALGLGWTLIAYEVQERMPEGLDPMGSEAFNWRDGHQARNLASALGNLDAEARLLVWCGNGHLTRDMHADWRSMAVQFQEITAIEPFSIDQTKSVQFEDRTAPAAPWVGAYCGEITERGGAAGFLAADAPNDWSSAGADAFIIARDNAMT